MTQEEKAIICNLIRKETACGTLDASLALDELIKALKSKTSHVVMDGKHNIKITWE